MSEQIWMPACLAGYAVLTALGCLYLKKLYPERKRAWQLYGGVSLLLLIMGVIFYRPARESIGIWLMMPLLSLISFEDAIARRVSNKLLIGMLALGLLCTLISSDTPLNRLVAPLVYGLIFILLSLASKGGLGMGDAKLIAVVSVYYGVIDMFSVLFVASLLECVMGLAMLVRTKNMRTELPFVPAIQLGSIVALFWMI